MFATALTLGIALTLWGAKSWFDRVSDLDYNRDAPLTQAAFPVSVPHPKVVHKNKQLEAAA